MIYLALTQSVRLIPMAVKVFLNFTGIIGKRNPRAGHQPVLQSDLWTLKGKTHPLDRFSELNKE